MTNDEMTSEPMTKHQTQMKQLKAILLEDSDLLPGTERMHWQSAMTKEANRASTEADLVLYRGQIIGNRFGPATSSMAALRPPPPLQVGDTIQVRGQTVRVGELVSTQGAAS